MNKKVNQKPVANAGEDREILLPRNSEILDGSQSEDKDGRISAYSWTKISSPSSYKIHHPKNKKTQVSGLVEGKYAFKLTVTDSDGAIASDEVIINVKKRNNTPPLANAGKDIAIILPKNRVMLDGSQSEDKDGKISSFNWKKISGPNSFKIQHPNNKKTEVSGLIEGIYTFRLTVTDNAGLKASDEVIVKVIHGNRKPIANAGRDIIITLPNSRVIVDGSASKAYAGELKYYWQKMLGPGRHKIHTPHNKKTEISSLRKGIYKFRLTITDQAGISSFDEIIVEVIENAKPVPIIKGEKEISLPQTSTILDGSDSYDKKGKITKYRWTKILGPNDVSIVHPNNKFTPIHGLKEGDYKFQLTVWDNDGLAPALSMS